ncbi:ANTAR domain-containing protein [Nocardia neocaledoniensis]|uniref:ANTAR domain-containing protein n=1 Tax=Nocardia neocaledoniensis TaxID=236511 RepID=UPI002456E95E|nr:hypothetical protein [Nocardia neocaledoniensis]
MSGSSLTDVTYVFDEPTAGLHPHDIQRMNDLLLRLREPVADRRAAAAALAEPGRVGGADDEFSRALVFNASGMVAVQLAVSAEEGLARLRAYCFAAGRPISEVAADIVARRLSLRDQRDTSGGQGG